MTVASLDLGPIGYQEPRIVWVPEGDWNYELADAAVELCETAGLELDPWERFVLRHSLALRPNRTLAFFEVAVNVARQNGKGAILEGRELAGMFLFREFGVVRSPAEKALTVHSAHQFDTSLEAFRRLLWLVEETPDLDCQVKRVSRSHGEEGIELTDGERIRFRTRTAGGGRGFGGDDLILDEAMVLPDSKFGTILPILSARPNPQVWYTGSAVDKSIHTDGLVFARLRQRAIAGGDPSLAYFEWSADGDIDDLGDVLDDEEAWRAANPGMGIRIGRGYVANERRTLDARSFAVERLGIGDWPDPDLLPQQGLSLETWLALVDPRSEIAGPVVFAVDTRPDRSMTAIAKAGVRRDGLGHVETVDHRPGTKWVPDRLVELAQSHEHVEFICDGLSPAATLLPAIERAAKEAGVQVQVKTLSTQEYGQAFGKIVDAVGEGLVRHLGTPELSVAVRGAIKRPLGDAHAWSRRSSGVDISPVVAVTLALWGVEIQAGPSVYASRGVAAI